jgi:hypothetical protein
MLALIAEAFELTPRDVFEDATIIELSGHPDAALYERLRQRHGWDDSVAPYYVAHLRRLVH